jgi:RNase adaptor protein for sRNA GlmZ degradation
MLITQVLANVMVSTYKNYQCCLTQIELQHNIRFAVESIERDAFLAKKIEVNNNVLLIFKGTDTTNEVVRYELSRKYHPYRLMRDDQPVTGNSINNEVEISSFSLIKKGNNILDVEIIGVDSNSSEYLAIDKVINIMNET